MNQELPDVQVGFRKGRGNRDKIASIHWIIGKAREFQINTYFSSVTTLKLLTVWITTNWKNFKEMGMPDHLTCLLRNLYAGQEEIFRTRCGKMGWFPILSLSPCLCNFYAEYIMKNAGLNEAQAGIKIARRNINKLRYADDTTLTAESEEELKSLLMKMKEESEKVGLKTQHSEN